MSSTSPSPVTPAPPIQPSNKTLSPNTPSPTKSPQPAPPPHSSPSTNPPPPPDSSSPPPDPDTSSPPPPNSSSPPPDSDTFSPPPPNSSSPPPDSDTFSPPPPNSSSPPPDPDTSSPPPPHSSSPPPDPDTSSPPPPNSSSPPPDPDTSSPPPPNRSSPPPEEKPPKIPPPPSPSPTPPPPVNHPPPASPKPPANPSPPPPVISPPPPSNTPPPPSLSPPASPEYISPPRSSTPPVKHTSPPSSPPSVLSPPSGARPSPRRTPPGIPSTNGSHAVQVSPPGNGTGSTVTAVLVLGFMLLGILGTVACCVWKRKRKASVYNCGYVMPPSHGSSPERDSELLKKPKLSPIKVNGSAKDFVYSPQTPGGFGNPKTWFAYKELVEATGEFSAQNLLGDGGFGSVYKGSLADGSEVAVKQLKVGGGHGEQEFRSEVEIISRIHHRHLVSLVGYCIHENRRLLVYEYVPNNNLYFHLHGKDKPVVDWAKRVKIAIGAARGLAYLHEDCHPRIIHRDIKSSNILLDKNFDARVSDFGLAKLAVDANSHVTTRVMGTLGYMAPEYASSGKLTEKSDVYSYGVVLLELITGRKPVDSSRTLGEESLVEWGRPMLSRALATHEFSGLTDPNLEFHFVDSEMFRMIEAAAACLRHSSARRPKMGQVARALDTMDMADLSNGMKVGESGMFNAANVSDEIRLFRRMAFGSQDHSTGFFFQDYCSSEGNHRVHSHRQVMQ